MQVLKMLPKYGVYREIKYKYFVDFHTYKYSSIILAIMRYLYEIFNLSNNVRFMLIWPKPVLNYSKIEHVEVDGIDHRDYPDYVDAFISEAFYDGRPMSDSELDVLNEDRDFVYQQVMLKIF